MAEITPPRPLAEADDRTAFDCGRDSINYWFRRYGWTNHTAGLSRVNVVCDRATGQIVGYVTLSAAQIERTTLPKRYQRNKPDPLPATLLGQLAIDSRYQGQGCAHALLLFALRTAIRASKHIASWGVITHPLDDSVRAFYARHGFQDLPYDPHRAMVVRMVDLEKSGFGPD